MNTPTKPLTLETVSKSRPSTAFPPMLVSSAPRAVVLQHSGLVEEAAALEQMRTLLGGHFHVSRREEKDLVCDALHAAVERVREPAGEVDQPLREILVGVLEIEDDGNGVLELVRDLLRVVEASRDDQVHADGHRPRYGTGTRPQGSGAVAPVGLGIRPVVELALAPPGREPADVRPLRVAALEVVVGDVALLIPIVFLGDAE